MKKKGAEIIVETLIDKGIDTVFGYPGGANIPIYDAIYGRSEIRHILTRHEQGAIHAADGYARATGKIGVVFATSGPGATNLVTGLANAYMDSVPLVAITGQVPTHMIGNDSFQEADIYGITVPITKYNYLVKDVNKLEEVINEALYIASTGRPGPVLIDIPKDIQESTAKMKKNITVRLPSYKPNIKGNPIQINAAVKAIDNAESPLLYAGGGVVASGACKELFKLAKKASIPVALTLMSMSAFPTEDKLCLGMAGMHGTKYANLAIRDCDLLIAVGARFDDRVTGNPNNFAKNASIIHIDIDPAEIGKIKKAFIPIVGDAKSVLSELADKVKVQKRRKWINKIMNFKKEFPLSYENSGKKIKPQKVIETLSELTKGDAIYVTDVGQHQMWSAQYLKFKHTRSFISSGGLGTMGFGFPAAIGAQIGNPKKTVVNITGDGSFQMTIQELATASNYKLPIKIILLNNGFLGMVRQWQQLFFDERYSFTDLGESPDFVKIAEGYGVKGMKIEKPSEVERAIKSALKYKGLILLDFRVEREENVTPMIPPGGSIETMME
ncbi:MAG: biosynthetic-type acetolactate synthase large subunit [Candidatus Schekmanbacteria bacterium]|nr:MAG: biosynthetic-type acetolactate synthase large subunit [Candidatus Schekmanbacteria bacterium]